MKAQIIQIGNSQGIRIPKTLLEESGIMGEVELEKHPDGILVRNTQMARAGWADSFKAMAEDEDGEFPEKTARTKFEKQGWQW